jgi:FkbM family methyltransferase
MGAVYRNLALGRPATQSSISRWSKGGSPTVDARGANNGVRNGEMGFHTGYEDRPWWQVDLGRSTPVHEIRLYNRRSNFDRLSRFTILASADGDAWSEIHAKSDAGTFGSSISEYYPVLLEPPVSARFVRVRRDEPGLLDFCECEVLGYAEADDDRNGYFTNVGAVEVFVDADAYSQRMQDALAKGTYEHVEREIVQRALKPDDRVFEIGSAVGAVSMTAAKIVGPAAVVTFEANPRIAKDARANFIRNGLTDISSRTAVLLNRKHFATAPAEMDFHVSRDFWASRLDPGKWVGDIVEVVKIKTACLEDEIAAHRANVLICDIEGGEIDLLTESDLAGIRLIIIEVHPSAVGEAAVDALISSFFAQGFGVNFYYSGRGVAVLRRLVDTAAEASAPEPSASELGAVAQA